MDRGEAEILSWPKLIGFTIGVGLFLWLLLCSESGFVFLVDHANLLFHEAGHVFVGLFSQRLEPYGGTMGQLVFPVVLAVRFGRKSQPLGLAAALLWLFENFFNIARYMADARTLELPLVGGGDHDWNTLFARWDILQYDAQIAAAVKTLGWLGIAGTCGWVLWRAWQDFHRRAATAVSIPHPDERPHGFRNW